MAYKFEKLDVWRLALDYVDLMYELADQLPHREDYNLKSQLTRAATSVALNIAEGSAGQTNMEQSRFLGLAIRSLLETVACQHIINRRQYLQDATALQRAYTQSQILFAKLQAMRKAIAPEQGWVREEQADYHVDGGTDVFDEFNTYASVHRLPSIVE
jgi:four helix bundle protein